ncbi:isochorismatase domain-containing protein 2-like [Hyalella azteca]|uniref:Isochorismatase domain-containing protein 2-like n=1 Tax=Hyalella azteca TaxID=294128 RepID=A0A8B7P7Z4_HYAAZ|nr:isochorismatase domain-containing protein 2-like [Hyalella azteca]
MALSSTIMRNIGKLSVNNSMLFICDMQEKFRNQIQYFQGISTNSARLIEAFKIMDMPVICTEQYPKGLGHTVPELELKKYDIKPVDKTQFSMCVPDVVEAIKKHEVQNVVLCGIECHVCVQQTALQLLQDGINVHLVADAVSSRSMTDRLVSLLRMRDSGAFLTTTESVVLGLAGGSHHPKFKPLQKIILEPSSDTGLLQHLTLN